MGLEKRKPLTADSLAADAGKGFSNVHGHPERVARLSNCKKRSVEMAKYLGSTCGQGDHREAMALRLRSCANYLLFHNYYTVEQVRLAKVKTCQVHLLCPFCARIRAAKQVRRYMERLALVMQENPGLVPAMLTLTVKNGPDLDERFAHLVKSFRTYQIKRRRYLSGQARVPFVELCKVDGACFSYEFTKGQDTLWHPHMHGVVLLNDYIDVQALSAEWQAITGDSFIVDVRKLQGDPIEAFCEVFKYALKFADLPLEDNWEAFAQLRGKRLQGSFGLLWGVKVPEDAEDEPLDLPYIEMLYKYLPQGYSLQSANILEGGPLQIPKQAI